MKKLVNGELVDLTAEEIEQREADESAWLVLQEAKKAGEYKTLRAKEYPPIGDQLDALMKWLATETEIRVPAELKSIAMKCMSVKAKYPKPEKA